MAVINISVPASVWTQVHDGGSDATLALAGDAVAQICQSASAPSGDVTGLPFVAGSLTHGVYCVTKGDPVFVRALSGDATVIVNT